MRGRISRQERIKQWRAAAVKRQKGKCMYCEESFGPDRPPTAEHIIPRSKGGRDAPHNIGAACEQCNKTRKNFKVTQGTINFLKTRPDLEAQEYSE